MSVFVMGTGRSGTTLMAAVLAATGLFTVHFQGFDAWKDTTGGSHVYQLTVEDIVNSVGAMERTQCSPGKFFAMHPGSKILLLLRDPLDVLASYWSRIDEAEKANIEATFYRAALLSSQLWAFFTWAASQDLEMLTVPFRNLIKSPGPTLEGVFDFLAVKISKKAILEAYAMAPSFNRGDMGRYLTKYRAIETKAVFETYYELPAPVLELAGRYLRWQREITGDAEH